MVNHILKNDNKILQGLMGKLIELNHFNQLFKNQLDAELAKHCQIIKLEKNCLHVVVDNGSWATQLRFQIPDLMESLRQEPKLSELKGIICKTRPNHLNNKAIRKTRKVSKLSPETANNILETAKLIQDTKLRQILERIAKHLKQD